MALPNYSKMLRPLPLIALTSLALLAQGTGHLSVGAIPKVTAKRGEAVQAKIPVAIDAGFHVNSDKPTEDYLIPLKLKWTAAGALEPGQIVYPKPTHEKVADQTLAVFTGSFDLVARFKVAPNAPAGPGSAAGKLTYQACNATTCFPPKTIDIAVPYAIQ